ncbi:MAG: permease, partial [candidate division Zixibacteria bacterium]|nr:permease [candidate division Zixibacteria bacterium]
MLDTVYIVAVEFWNVLADMAPYLILGFLVAGVLSVTVSTRLVERHLGDRGFWSITKASLLGIPLPLCSCGV